MSCWDLATGVAMAAAFSQVQIHSHDRNTRTGDANVLTMGRMASDERRPNDRRCTLQSQPQLIDLLRAVALDVERGVHIVDVCR